MGNVYDCHSASRSSSWKRLFGEISFNQKSATMNSKLLFDVTRKLVRDQEEIQGISVIDWRENVRKRTALLTDWPGSSFINSESLRFLRFSTCAWAESVKSRKRMEGENRLVYEFILMLRIGSNRRGADGVRVEKFPRIHYIAASRRDPEHDDWNTVWTWATPRTNHLHVNVQRHCKERKRKRRIVHCDFP